MTYVFNTGAELLACCREEGIPIHEAMIRRELELGDLGRNDLREEMQRNLTVMRASVEKGLEDAPRSVSGLSGGDAQKLDAYQDKAFLGKTATRAAAAAMAVVEVNAAMGRIVAAPTAGASGILPGVLLAAARRRNWSDDKLIDGLFTAAAIGAIIAAQATIAGAEGGCQAETGAGAAMAAAAIAALSGAQPPACLDAAAIALKNVMGLVCDPVAGLVECPCIKRNAMGAVNALLAADLVMAGVSSVIPFDETVSAMRSVGKALPLDLRETARGGLAATPTGRRIAEGLN